MAYPGKGKADYLALGDFNAACAECARKFKASEMIQLPAGVPGGTMYVCQEHWNARQPQDFVRGIPDKMASPWQQPIVMTDFTFDSLLITEASVNDNLAMDDYNYILTEDFYPLSTES